MKLTILAAAALLVCSGPAHAVITWDRSFAGEEGTFTTDGNAPGSIAAPGTFDFIDFSVTSSAFGRPLGRVSGGQYLPAGYDTNLPYSFAWDGASVTLWESAGSNNFNWWVFSSVANPDDNHLFGWNSGNINDVTSAALSSISVPQSVGSVSVAVADMTAAAVPEPATWLTMILGFGAIGFGMRRKQRQTVRYSFA